MNLTRFQDHCLCPGTEIESILPGSNLPSLAQGRAPDTHLRNDHAGAQPLGICCIRIRPDPMGGKNRLPGQASPSPHLVSGVPEVQPGIHLHSFRHKEYIRYARCPERKTRPGRPSRAWTTSCLARTDPGCCTAPRPGVGRSCWWTAPKGLNASTDPSMEHPFSSTPTKACEGTANHSFISVHISPGLFLPATRISRVRIVGQNC